MRLFHDEQAERVAALAALHAFIADDALELVDERLFRAGVAYARIGTPRAGLFERLMRLTLARKT
ncbi:hypothetical protein JQX09_22665 [Sulfitobacter pseudonitzschiae]|nr:hypothetical protein [Pseudosulfitobacter pseudonitzschiae]MBM1839957.1 hypothetical protein [Pseudosulfitobacter pseudonitzschiae]MBM1849603.1 hypothetical protein [Pseudosulfitobacter pseudonitzschiae]MBM1878654.1 hypothetical protein [Pseudosulfitobacter pseudonitzschiae]MBM1897840.1 hypothetical protein [Pseudosulfitobacter pseudonitzschiae]MBM1907548.1 hypothetical protein [Pseudosulfitobacter pseudonitzschiae]